MVVHITQGIILCLRETCAVRKIDVLVNRVYRPCGCIIYLLRELSVTKRQLPLTNMLRNHKATLSHLLTNLIVAPEVLLLVSEFLLQSSILLLPFFACVFVMGASMACCVMSANIILFERCYDRVANDTDRLVVLMWFDKKI